MQNAIIIHGTTDREEYFSDEYPSLSNSHWIPWLQKQLLMKDVLAQTPEMPEAHLEEPNYLEWVREFQRFDVNESTILVGHSTGGGFLLRWLSENKVKVGKVVLVAPWLDVEKNKTKAFFNFIIDSNIINRVEKLKVFVSKNDDEDILKSVDFIRKMFPKECFVEFENYGHFTYGAMGKYDFPELLRELI